MWRNTSHAYGLVSVVLHWAIALLFIGQLALGYGMTLVENMPGTQFELFQLHKSIGFLILALAVSRLMWALFNPAPRPAGAMAPWEGLAAKLVKIALFGLTVAVPLLGWALVSASPLGIPSYVFNLVVIPDLPLPASNHLESLLSRSHALLAYSTGLVALLHVLAALRHHFIRRDRTLERMLLRREARK